MYVIIYKLSLNIINFRLFRITSFWLFILLISQDFFEWKKQSLRNFLVRYLFHVFFSSDFFRRLVSPILILVSDFKFKTNKTYNNIQYYILLYCIEMINNYYIVFFFFGCCVNQLNFHYFGYKIGSRWLL